MINDEHLYPRLQMEIQDEHVIRMELDPEGMEAARKRIKDKLDRLRRGDHLRNND